MIAVNPGTDVLTGNRQGVQGHRFAGTRPREDGGRLECCVYKPGRVYSQGLLAPEPRRKLGWTDQENLGWEPGPANTLISSF